ncbi:hypothetical protein P3718_25900, partial [Vibrio parahaemolyticus]|nr:hypothetical protein [Vibrio parahaemolyticus]
KNGANWLRFYLLAKGKNISIENSAVFDAITSVALLRSWSPRYNAQFTEVTSWRAAHLCYDARNVK